MFDNCWWWLFLTSFSSLSKSPPARINSILVLCPINIFYIIHELRMIFTFLNGWGKKIHRRKIFCDTWKFDDIQIWVSIILLLGHRNWDSFVYMLSINAFILHQQNWVVAKEDLKPAKPKLFIIWVCWPPALENFLPGICPNWSYCTQGPHCWDPSV